MAMVRLKFRRPLPRAQQPPMLGVEATKDTQESQPVDFFKYLLEQQHHWLFVEYIIQMEELDGTSDNGPWPLKLLQGAHVIKDLKS